MISRIKYPPKPWRTFTNYVRLLRTFKNWTLYFKMKKQRQSSTVFQYNTRGGIVFKTPAKSQQLLKDIFMYDAYALDLLFKNLKQAPVVIDIGANIGLFSLCVLNKLPQAICISVEPFPANFQMLEANRALNKATNWRSAQVAVSGSRGLLHLFAPKGGGCTADATLMEPAEADREHFESVSVECITLADLFSKFAIDECDWLKADCEGAEYDIFYSAPDDVLSKIMAISLETHHVDNETKNSDALVKFLVGKGFKTIYKADDQVVHALREPPQPQPL